MDLRTAEQRNGRHWQPAKAGALLCFFIASLLLLAALLFPSPEQAGSVVTAATSALR
jgi:hypothetical protein